MAKQIIEKLIDDLDGGDASETIPLRFEGISYTIDLSEKNATALREALAPYIAAGSSLGRTTNTWPARTQRNSRDENQAIREWASQNGQELAARGRIPHSVVAAYEAAKNTPAAPAAPPTARATTARRAPRKSVPAVEFAAH